MAYVGETGLQRKTLQEVRLEIEQALKNVFGVSFETSVDSPNGLLISQLSLSISNIWELAQEVYISRDPAQASGVTLDWIAALSGLSRKEATACRVGAMLYTEEASADIPAGSLAMRQRGSLDFALDEAVSIDREACQELMIYDNGSAKSTAYVFHFTFGDVTLNNSTSSANLNVLQTAIIAAGGSAVMPTGTVDGGLKVTVDGSTVGITGAMPEDFIIRAGMPGDFTATSTGVQTCEVGELDSIPVAVTGWDAVYNYSAGIPGTERETDTELRARRAAAVRSIQARGTDPAIAAHLIEDVTGVTTAVVFSNRTMSTDADGRPPKSFEALVVGGSDQDVARCIWENQPAGIQSYGNTSVQIVDGAGDGQTVSFSRPQAKYLWVKVTYKLYDEEQAPTDAELKAAIVTWSEREYQMGTDVIPSRVLQGLYTGTTGVGQASVQVALTDEPTDTPSYSSNTLSVSPIEYAALVAARVTLVRTT